MYFRCSSCGKYSDDGSLERQVCMECLEAEEK